MADLKPLTANEILDELNLKDFISRKDELATVEDSMRTVLNAQIDHTYDHANQIEATLAFIKALWKKYDCEPIASIYEHFIKFEEALFGLERDQATGKRYRDHFIHMFNCYTFGLRIISKLLAQTNDPEARSMFKVYDEDLKAIGLPFSSNYTYKQRLFYLWTLISTFHDIAIPFQHLSKLSEGVNKYVSEFGWEFTEPSISMRSFDSSHLHHYFRLLAGIYGGQLEYDITKKKYKLGTSPQHYLKRVLGREFDNQNHGVISGLCLWKLIEDIFLMGRSKYKLGSDAFDVYTEYVLEQDITRAALAISLHSLKSDIYPHLFPLGFREFPLTFILLLSDELQEFLRWEGTSIKGSMKFNYQPRVNLEIGRTGKDITAIRLAMQFALDEKQEAYVTHQAREIAKRESTGGNIASLDEAVDVIGNSIKRVITKKLKLRDPMEVKLTIYKDWKIELYSKDLTN